MVRFYMNRTQSLKLELNCKPKLSIIRKPCWQTYHDTFRKRVKTVLNYSEFALNYGCLRPIHISVTLMSTERATCKSLRAHQVDGKLNQQIYQINSESRN